MTFTEDLALQLVRMSYLGEQMPALSVMLFNAVYELIVAANGAVLANQIAEQVVA